MTTRRFRIEFTGRVQGVGFRPTVYRYAREFDLRGWVSNGPEGVTIEAEGEERSLARFIDRMQRGLPARAAVGGFHVCPIPVADSSGPFEIRPSRSTVSATHALVPPDLGICEDCRREVLDPADRRYLYPFTNCTNCGPRFSMVTAVPYDRPNTTMRDFPMCPDCRAEYNDPANRRFHAEPNACPACGPRLTWIAGRAREMGLGTDIARLQVAQLAILQYPCPSLSAATEILAGGGIVAIQSIGGFHIACDARRMAAVETLRRRKNRPHKPLAVMAADLAAARAAADLTALEENILSGPEAPIVTVPSSSAILKWIAPGLRRMGILLPYTPLHLALFQQLRNVNGPDLLVMTSGNPPGEPICRTPAEAIGRLDGLVDGFLIHDRPIHNRLDDSVVVSRKSGAHCVRLARGYVPVPVSPTSIGRPLPVIFAAGADLKSAACVTRSGEAFLTQYAGDLGQLANETFYDEAIERMVRFLDVKPEIVVHDLHPDMVSTRAARRFASTWGVPPESVHAVQHHHAHVAAAMAEHGLSGPVIGVALDGAGYGEDGTVWGCEWFVGRGQDFTRVGHLLPVSLPGGDKAAVEIWRMGVAWLMAAFGEEAGLRHAAYFFKDNAAGKIERIARICGRPRRPGLSAVTSSAGRLFDAVSALAGLGSSVTYEGQAAMELEAAYDDRVEGEYEIRLRGDASSLVIDPRPAIRAAVSDRLKNAPPAVLSTRFHRGMARAVVSACARISESTGLNRVAAGGGVFQNMRLLDLLDTAMLDADLEWFVPSRVPANDGGIALGQAWIAAQKLREGR